VHKHPQLVVASRSHLWQVVLPSRHLLLKLARMPIQNQVVVEYFPNRQAVEQECLPHSQLKSVQLLYLPELYRAHFVAELFLLVSYLRSITVVLP